MVDDTQQEGLQKVAESWELHQTRAPHGVAVCSVAHGRFSMHEGTILRAVGRQMLKG